jgi:hypothetical protein
VDRAPNTSVQIKNAPSPFATNFLSESSGQSILWQAHARYLHAAMGARGSSMQFGAMPNVNGE